MTALATRADLPALLARLHGTPLASGAATRSAPPWSRRSRA